MTFALIPQRLYCVSREDALRLVILTLPLLLPPSEIPILNILFSLSQYPPPFPIPETARQQQASYVSSEIWMYFFIWKEIRLLLLWNCKLWIFGTLLAGFFKHCFWKILLDIIMRTWHTICALLFALQMAPNAKTVSRWSPYDDALDILPELFR